MNIYIKCKYASKSKVIPNSDIVISVFLPIYLILFRNRLRDTQDLELMLKQRKDVEEKRKSVWKRMMLRNLVRAPNYSYYHCGKVHFVNFDITFLFRFNTQLYFVLV